MMHLRCRKCSCSNAISFQPKESIIVCDRCGEQVCTYNDGIFDIINELSMQGEAWGPVMGDGAGILKQCLDAILWKILPPLLNKDMVRCVRDCTCNGSRVIEMGCGEATASRMLLLDRQYGCMVLMDICNRSLQRTVQHLRRDVSESLYVIRGDFYNTEVPFESLYYDVAYNNGVIEHFSDPVKAVREMARIAKVVVCAVPAKSIYFKLGTLLRRIVEKDASHWLQNTTYYTQRELKEIFEQAHLSMIRVKTVRLLGIPVCHYALGYSQ